MILDRRKRSVDLDPDGGRAVEQPGLAQTQREFARRPHRSDRVRARRSDADGEQIENADRHYGERSRRVRR